MKREKVKPSQWPKFFWWILTRHRHKWILMPLSIPQWHSKLASRLECRCGYKSRTFYEPPTHSYALSMVPKFSPEKP